MGGILLSVKTTGISTVVVMAVNSCIGNHSFTLGGVSFLLNKIKSGVLLGF